MSSKIYVIGVGMTKFEKPGVRDDFDYPLMAKEAVTKALNDAKVNFADIQQACVGYVYGDSTCGQRAIYEVGMTGIPVYNVNNNCSTGSTALILAKQLLETGNNQCVLALGFEKMEKGSLTSKFLDRTNPMDKHVQLMADLSGLEANPITAQLFGNAAKEHMQKYGSKPEHYWKIAYKNHLHSKNNPYSQFQDEYSLEQIKNSPKVFELLTKLQCCPTSDGAAAAVLATEAFVKKHNLQKQAVEIVGMEMATDLPSTFQDRSHLKIIGYDMTKYASKKLFDKVPYKPTDVNVIELHDCFSANELITYEALGLCKEGEAGQLVDSNNNTYGGKYVVNPSGGLISKGHPLGATGLAQCAELCWQLRGEAGKRQVANAKLALQHNIGLGGAVVVALYKLGFPELQDKSATIVQNTNDSSDENEFEVAKYFKILQNEMNNDKENLVQKFRGIYGIRVKKNNGKEGYWVINTKKGTGKIEYNGKDKPEVTFLIKDEDVIDFITGKLNPQKAFFQGKVKIKGNMGLAMKLTQLQNLASGKINDLKAKL